MRRRLSLQSTEVSTLERIICPAMSIDDKYRTMYSSVMSIFNNIAKFAEANNLPPEQFQGLINAAMRGVGEGAGKRLVKEYKLKPTVEDAVKLLLLLNNETLAYLPKLKSIYGEIEGNAGFLVVRNDPWYDWYFKSIGVNCEESCTQHEFFGLVKELGGNFKIEVVESRPRGDDHCRFMITREK
jgi:hypothetical protein